MKCLIILTIFSILLSSYMCWAETFTTQASWYSRESCLKESGQYVMGNGKELRDEDYTCAIWGYKFDTILKVTNIENGLSVKVKVTDRGPAERLVKKGRRIDLSYAAMRRLDGIKQGVISVKVEVL